jgi:hypothetical protein
MNEHSHEFVTRPPTVRLYSFVECVYCGQHPVVVGLLEILERIAHPKGYACRLDSTCSGCIARMGIAQAERGIEIQNEYKRSH